MKEALKLIQLRVVAGILGIAVAIPILLVKASEDALQGAALTARSAPILYVVVVVAAVLVFIWLRSRTAGGAWSYVIFGAVVGAAPGIIYSSVSLLSPQPVPLFMMTLVGALTGGLAGLAIRSWDQGL